MNICEGSNDLVLEKKMGTLKFIHITYPEHLEKIYLEGLRKSSGEETNFGIDVVYVASKTNLTSIMALAELSRDYTGSEEEEDFVIIHGTYTGKYLECIAADEKGLFSYNIGFIGLLEEDNLIIEKHEIVKGYDVKGYILKQYIN